MSDYSKFLLAKLFSWIVLIAIMILIFGPVLALLAQTWFVDWPRWGVFLFNLGICGFVYNAKNTQHLREEVEIFLRRRMGVKY